MTHSTSFPSRAGGHGAAADGRGYRHARWRSLLERSHTFILRIWCRYQKPPFFMKLSTCSQRETVVQHCTLGSSPQVGWVAQLHEDQSVEIPTFVATCTQMKHSVISCETPREPELIEKEKACHPCVITSSAKFSRPTEGGFRGSKDRTAVSNLPFICHGRRPKCGRGIPTKNKI